ncbi:hypothetical protein MSPP1_004061 [Malassezia sp. CBS 17886]|nr:hypothetical protein MSPP1_004061 [Malassezia sp. CBS 17886]
MQRPFAATAVAAARAATRAPPPAVANFRNMQRRRGDAFRFDVRVARKPADAADRARLHLREHLFQTSRAIDELAARAPDPLSAFKDAEALLHERMDAWNTLSRRLQRRGDHPTPPARPVHAAAAWNQVINLALGAHCPSAAWRLYCAMKRSFVRPTALTYSGYFHGLTAMVRAARKPPQEGGWQKHLDSLYLGLQTLHQDTAGAKRRVESDADAPRGQDAPSHARRAADALVVAYRGYMSLLCALHRADDALVVLDDICPDPYPGRRRADAAAARVPRHVFATTALYTGFVRDVMLCPMPLSRRHAIFDDVWTRWQNDIMLGRRTRRNRAVLDETAVKTLVWALGSSGRPQAVRDVSSLLGTYVGVPLTKTAGVLQYSVPDAVTPVPLTDSRLLLDIMTFYDRHAMYTQVLDVYRFATRGGAARGSGAARDAVARDRDGGPVGDTDGRPAVQPHVSQRTPNFGATPEVHQLVEKARVETARETHTHEGAGAREHGGRAGGPAASLDEGKSRGNG